MKSEQGPNLLRNDSKVRDPTFGGKEMESKSLSETSKLPRNDSFQSQVSSTMYPLIKTKLKIGLILRH